MFKTPQWFYTFIPFKFAAGCSSPLIPLLVISLGGTATDISIVSSAYSSVSMIFLIIWGKLSDSTQKRKPFLVMGFAGFSLTLLLFSQVTSIPYTVYLQITSAVFAAATVPISSVYILRSARKEFWDQAIGEFNKISGYAWAFGMLFGTLVLAVVGIQILFVVLGIICFSSAVVFQKMVREKPIYINRDKIVSFANVMTEKMRLMPSYIIHFPQFMSFETRKLKNFYLASFVLFLSSGIVFTPFVYFLTEKGASASFVFLISFLNSMISAYTYSKAAKKVALFGGFSILGKGLILRALFFFVLIIASVLTKYYAVGVAAVCYCVFGYTWAHITVSSNSVMSRLAIEGKEGKIMGMYNFMASLGLITGNMISGVVVDAVGFTWEFLVGLIVIMMSFFWIQKIKQKEDTEMKMRVKKAFEKTMAERKKWWNVLTFQKIDSYLNMAGIKKGYRALDVAAGDGIVASRLAKKGCHVVALDISSQLFFQKIEDVQYTVGDAEQLEYSEEFDVVTCRNAFHYFPNPSVVLRKMKDALKEDGRLLLMEPVATEESYSFLRRIFERKAPVRNFYTGEELADMVTSEGFAIQKIATEDYTNWLKTDSEEKAEGVRTSYKNGILYFNICNGYVVIVARKKSLRNVPPSPLIF
jgi:ubiquinone/menaquinone biosynthesis C-methylase UbiE/predicted MFS family arabinose efflux permease